jgi:hypothetical protein
MRTKMLAFWLLVVVLTGCCQPTPDVTRQSTNTHFPILMKTVPSEPLSQSCMPPCWEGITPGVTTEEDVIRALDRLEAGQEITSYFEFGTGYDALLTQGGTFQVTISGGVVDGLDIDIEKLDKRVKDTFSEFGDPEGYALAFKNDRENCPCDSWNDQYYSEAPSRPGYLLFPSQGVTALIDIPDRYIGCICSDMKVIRMIYYQPLTLDAALQSSPCPAFRWFDWKVNDIVDWHGYGPGY